MDSAYIFPPRKAEVANGITHGLGILFSLSVITLAVLFPSESAVKQTSMLIFASCMMAMYSVSTIYHLETRFDKKVILRLLDHISIYFLIAGTYTPFIRLCLSGTIQWIFLCLIWAIAILGVFYKLFLWKRFPKVSLFFYLTMGWMVVFFIRPIYETMSFSGFMWLIIGGLFYSGGTYFYSKDKKLYNHAVWHLFVLAGSACHFEAIATIAAK